MCQYKDELSKVIEYTISNDEVELSVLNFGATVTSIRTKDKDGKVENILASFDDVESYFSKPGPYLNAMVGPVAGRIGYGQYSINGEVHSLSINNGKNHLHGGTSGISKQFFNVEKDTNSITLTLDTDHDVDGFTGTYHYEIKYILNKNTLTIEAKCTPENKTILNMTSHMYFNLSGELKNSINEHLLTLPASKKTKIHEDGQPCCIMPIIEGSAFDFRTAKLIGRNFEIGDEEFNITRGYDTAFVLNGDEPIELVDKESGRTLEIHTDQKSVVVYSANYFDDDLTLNEGRKGYPFSCLAMETQDTPNGINIEGVSTKIYDKDTPYNQKTTYIFGIIE